MRQGSRHRDGGVDQAVIGAQAGGYNLESSGVVMLGTYSGVLPTRAALSSLQRLIAWKLSLHGVPVSGVSSVEVDPSDAFYTRFAPGQRVSLPRVAGHRDGCTTDCPGAALYAHLPVVRANVKALAAGQLNLSCDFAAGQNAVPASDLNLANLAVNAGSPVALVGRLRAMSSLGALGAPVPGAGVEIQSLIGQDEAQLSAGAGPLSLSTDSQGAYSAQFTPTQNVLVRALHADTKAVASPLLAVGVAPVLTLTLDAGVVSSPPTLSGSVSPYKKQVEILVYAGGGAHKLVHHQTVEPALDGTFAVRPKLPAGSYFLRARSVADDKNISGQSPRLTLRI